MKAVRRHLLAVVCTALLALLTVALITAGKVVVENAYLSKGFYRTIVHLLSADIGRLALPVLSVAVVVAVISALWYRFSSYGDRMLALFLGLVPGLAFFLKLGYDRNRLDYSEYWHARHELLGLRLPEALFRSDVWRTNALIFLGALSIGIVVWLASRRGLRGPDGSLRRFWRWAGRPVPLAIVLCLILAAPAASWNLKRSARGKPSFLLISLDALRFSHLGCYGYQRDTSPEMDRLAEKGIKFEWAICQAPTTLPSHMSTLTSLYPTVHGCRMGRALPGPRLTLAEYLRENGYGTVGCVDGGYMSGWYGFDQGFERYDDRYKGFASAVRTFLHWLDSGLSDGPFFALMHTYDIHSPYDPPQPYRDMFTDPNYDGGFNPTSAELKRVRKRVDTNPEAGPGLSKEDVQFIIDRYDGGIRYVDDWIKKLMNGLRDRGLLESTWVVITADHGEEFTEHGVVLHGKLYLTVARVPLIIIPPSGAWGDAVTAGSSGADMSGAGGAGEESAAGAPADTVAGRTIVELVELLDLMPTFLDLAGVAPVDTLEGQSMNRLMRGDASGWRNLAFSEHHGGGGRRSVVSPTLHAITSLESRELEVYDYHADPLEQTTLADSTRAEEIKEISDILWSWIREQIRLAAGGEGMEPAEIDKKTIDELRTLGYIE